MPEDRLVRRFSRVQPATLKTCSLAADVAGIHRTRFATANNFENNRRWDFACKVYSHFLPFPLSHPHSREKGFCVPIPMGIPWDPWEFPTLAHLYSVPRCRAWPSVGSTAVGRLISVIIGSQDAFILFRSSFGAPSVFPFYVAVHLPTSLLEW